MTFNDWYQTRIDQISEAMQEYLKKKKPCMERKSEQGYRLK